jgi:signal transduction histidine kinase
MWCPVTRSTEWLSQRIYFLAASLYFVAVALRAWLFFRDSPYIGRALGLLLLWLLLATSEPVLSQRWSAYFSIYLTFQTALVFLMMALPGTPGFMGALLGVLSMQVMMRLPTWVGAIWIGLCGVIMALLLAKTYPDLAIALTLLYTAANIFLGSYIRTIRHAQAASLKNQALSNELEHTNRRLQDYSAQLEQLAVARERNRLARELHDSVTQTVFSMSLTAQSAVLFFERDRLQVGAQLERLFALSRSALAEMQLLIDELKPVPTQQVGLLESLQRLIADSRFSDNISVSIDVEGNQPLESSEELGLFRIAQEALNNILKHAQTSSAQVRLHLQEPFWVEIEDHGPGFDLQRAQRSGHMGLASMRERAAEIGWVLQIETSPGAGTRIRVEKPGLEEGRNGISRV